MWVLIRGLDLSFLYTSVKTDASRPLCLKNHIICMVFICRAIQKHLLGRLTGRCLLSKDNMLHNVGDCVFLIQPLAQFGRLEGLHVFCFLAWNKKTLSWFPNWWSRRFAGEHPTSPWICGCAASHLVYLVMVYNPSHVRTYVKILQ